MFVQMRLNVTADELFDVLLNSIHHDIEQAKAKKVPIFKIKTGYTYTKILKNKIGQKTKATATITKLEKPTSYEITFKSGRGVNTVAYELKTLDEDVLEVTYSENYEAKTSWQAINNTLMSKIFTRPASRKAKALIGMMEAYILQMREQKKAS